MIDNLLRRLTPYRWLLLFAALALIVQSQSELHQALMYQRNTLFDQPYRLLTHLLVHTNWPHFIMNLAALLALALLFPAGMTRTTWCAPLLVTTLMSVLTLYLLNPNVVWYVGLSGALHGLLLYNTLITRTYTWLAGIVILKLLAEQIYMENDDGGVTSALIDAPVIYDAHLYGALGGLLSGVLVRQLIHWKEKSL